MAALGAAALFYWLSRPPVVTIVPNVPGMDGRPASLPMRDSVRIGTIFENGPGKPSQLPGDWPSFRGPDFTAIARPSAPLAEAWPSNGPPVRWAVDLGEGYAAPAVRAGRVYVLDYDESLRADMLRCLSLDDGRELWRRGYTVPIKRNHGMSRTIPAVSERCVVTIGPRGHTMGVEADSGRFLWGIDMERRFGTRVPDWYTGQCPLIDGDIAVLAPCGTNVFMVGVDLATGGIVWQTPSAGEWKMSHSSIAPGTIAGRRMYVYAAVGGLVGVAADGPERGRVLWQTAEWRAPVIAPAPVILPDGRIFVTAGYGAGGMVFQVAREGEAFTVTVVRKFGPRDGLACEQQTPVYEQGRLFGVLTKDAGANRTQFACADHDGAILWTSGKDVRFGFGPFMVAGDRFLILDDDGVLTMARADTERFQPMARARVLEGSDSWGPMALVGTRLLLRDSKRMVCLELGIPEGSL
jgi:outer membrane protein assembly factor BamB